MKKVSFLLLIFVLHSNSTTIMAQSEPEEIKQESDLFADAFYESLLQKGIENYDKAVVALDKCLKVEPNNAIVYFELGKNYLSLKDYKNAYNSFERATQIDPKNEWFWVGMYDVSYETRNFKQAIVIINKLITFDSKYKEDLTSLYMATNQYEKALALINELNENVGKSERRDSYKAQILSEGRFQNDEIASLMALIEKSPSEEVNYISLINLYVRNKEEDKALETAKKLAAAIPTSEWAQVSLFKNYLQNNEPQKAINAMNISLGSAKIDSKIKHRMFNEFLIYTDKNPQYTAALEKAISYLESEKDVNVAKEVGKFYHSKKQWEKAIKYYEMALQTVNAQDVETNLLLLQAYTETKNFEAVGKKAMSLIESFPSQPQFYYFSGLAQNQMLQFKKAKEILEMGMDYVVDDKALEINFNIQLGEAYNGLGDNKKKELYFSKANQLLKEKK